MEKLSRQVSYALRHAPWEYELEMDAEGWVPLDQLIEALRREAEWRLIGEKDLTEMINLSEKKRHEIKDGKIRAFYGHSVPMKILKNPEEPPEILYHGTVCRYLEAISKSGLKPQQRQYVHLSQDIETALTVGKRHGGTPCILKVNAKSAWSEGVRFYWGNEKVWLADEVPSKYIERLD